MNHWFTHQRFTQQLVTSGPSSSGAWRREDNSVQGTTKLRRSTYFGHQRKKKAGEHMSMSLREWLPIDRS